MATLEARCPSCTTLLPSEADYCPKCGAGVQRLQNAEGGDSALAALERAVGSQYKVIRLLGRGGMGAVYLARERALDRMVAIKVLRVEASDSEGSERFLREARTAARLTHPNIVPLHTFGEAEGLMYFVMGFVQGESLGEKLKREGRLDPDEVRRILADVAAALHYAHERGVVHRDIKPDNILIDDETGKPMLADFGIARSAAGGRTLTELGTTLGTPHYMSPEQAAAERDVDGRSDLYSLGVVGYQMLAGRCPFEGATARDVMIQHISREPLPLKAVAPTVPDDLADVVARLLEKDRDKRLADGRVLGEALRGGIEGEEWMPEDLEGLVTEARPAPWLAAGSLYVSYGAAMLGDWWTAAGCVALGGLFAVLPVVQRRARKLMKYSWRAILPRILRKPNWWTTWWPRSLRARDDLWDRLPEEVRRFRAAYGPAIAGVLLALPVFVRAGWGDPSIWWFQLGLPLAVLPGGAGAGVLAWRAIRLQRWGRRVGLRPGEVTRLMEEGDKAAIWKKPHIQRLLGPPTSATGADVSRAPRSPAEYVEALTAAAAALEGPARELAREAAGAGRDVLEAMEELDRQIAQLASDADPAERTALDQKLKALGEPMAHEMEARRRMRRLLEEQLQLAQSLAVQLEAARDRRAHLADILKTLWLQIANLKAHHRDASFDSAQVSGRIRAVTDDAKRYLEASDSVARMLEPPAGP